MLSFFTAVPNSPVVPDCSVTPETRGLYLNPYPKQKQKTTNKTFPDNFELCDPWVTIDFEGPLRPSLCRNLLGSWTGRHSSLLYSKAFLEYEECMSQDGEYELWSSFTSESFLPSWSSSSCQEFGTDTIPSLCSRIPKFPLFLRELKHLSSTDLLWPVCPGSWNS